MVTVKSFILLISVCVAQVECGDYIPDKKCATLYSAPNFGGNSFVLKDFDESIDLTREYRQSLNGWPKTGSIRVEKDCKITMCNSSYFEQHCDSYSNDVPNLDATAWVPKSASCTCERTCTCEDIYVKEYEHYLGWDSVGRAYQEGGCDICNAKYLNLRIEDEFFPSATWHDIQAFVLRKGCSVTMFTGRGFTGYQYPVAHGPVYRGWNGSIESYKTECDTDHFNKDPPPRFKTYLPLGALPATLDALQEMLFSNETLANHPGIQAVIESVKKGMSSRNAYILLFENFYTRFDAFRQLSMGLSDDIREFQIPVGADDIRSTSQLRIIVAPIGRQGERVIDQRYVDRRTQELAEYLSAHEDLNDALPNAIIVHRYLDDEEKIPQDDPIIENAMKTLSALRHRLIVGNFSNVMFLLQPSNSIYYSHQNWHPESELENVLIKKYGFSTPITINIMASGASSVDTYVNGYAEMAPGDYWPKSMENCLINICERGGDPLGKAIFKAAFQDNWTPHQSIHSVQDMMDHNRFDFGPEAVPAEPSDYDGSCECSTIKEQFEQEIEMLKMEIEDMKRQISDNADRIREIWSEMGNVV